MSADEDRPPVEPMALMAAIAAALAHDLNSPLEAIHAACRQALAAEQEEASRLLLDVVERHLPRLKRNLLDLRSLAPDSPLPVELVSDPIELARRVVASAAAQPKWAGVRFSLEGAAAPIFADSALVERALANLVGNAADGCIHLAARGTAEVRVRISDQSPPSAMAVEVVDTGVGLAPNLLRDVQAGRLVTTKRSSGVGLGLAIVRRIAILHDGSFAIDSEPGRGTTARFTIARRVSTESPLF